MNNEFQKANIFHWSFNPIPLLPPSAAKSPRCLLSVDINDYWHLNVCQASALYLINVFHTSLRFFVNFSKASVVPSSTPSWKELNLQVLRKNMKTHREIPSSYFFFHGWWQYLTTVKLIDNEHSNAYKLYSADGTICFILVWIL